MSPLFSDEVYIKEEADKDLRAIKSLLSILEIFGRKMTIYKGENNMKNLKAKEIVERGISDMRRSVEDCNLDVLDRILLVSDENRRGLHSDKSINRDEYSIYNRQLNELINKFQKNCHCSKK